MLTGVGGLPGRGGCGVSDDLFKGPFVGLVVSRAGR